MMYAISWNSKDFKWVKVIILHRFMMQNMRVLNWSELVETCVVAKMQDQVAQVCNCIYLCGAWHKLCLVDECWLVKQTYDNTTMEIYYQLIVLNGQSKYC